MATATRIKKSRTDVPQNLPEVSGLVARIGRCQRELDKIEIRIKEKIARIREETREAIETHRKERNRLMNAVFSYAGSRRDELIEAAGGKTVSLPDGTIGWRFTPPSVSVDDDKEMIKILKEMGLPEFIRTKEELNREALLSERENLSEVPGLGFTRREEFVVVPKDHSTEVVKTRTIRLD